MPRWASRILLEIVVRVERLNDIAKRMQLQKVHQSISSRAETIFARSGSR
jgi:hypothetical protein